MRYRKYRVHFKENYCLQFTLNKATFKSVYLPLEPYKEMDGLRDFNYAVFSNGKIIRANSHDFDLGLEAEELPKVGSWEKIEKENYDMIVFRKDADTYNDKSLYRKYWYGFQFLHFSFRFFLS
ncbi:MAG: hypothetical protein R2879_17065 [Saprospiraceae bacterium]